MRVVAAEEVQDLAPVILKPDPVTITVGQTYVDPGITCTDDRDPNPTIHVIDHQLDTSAPGHYNVYYTCEDSAGNSSHAYRTVTVVPADP